MNKKQEMQLYDLEERIVMLKMAIETLEEEKCFESLKFANIRLRELLTEEKKLLPLRHDAEDILCRRNNE